MAIVVDYTPMGAVGQMAQQAGLNAVAQRQVDFERQQDLAQLNQQLEQRSMQFRSQLLSQARAEEAMYHMKFIAAKRDIDIQMELDAYSRDRQKLKLALDTIRDADYLSEPERENLTIQATAMYGNVGTGISPASFTSPMERQYQTSMLKQAKLDEVREMYNAGQINEIEAQQMLAPFGMGSVKFGTDTEVFNKKLESVTKRLSDAQERLTKSFIMDGKKVLDKQTERTITKKNNPDAWALYETLSSQVERARLDYEDFVRSKDTSRNANDPVGRFYDDVQRSPQLQKMVMEQGEEEAMKIWSESLKRLQPARTTPYVGLGPYLTQEGNLGSGR